MSRINDYYRVKDRPIKVVQFGEGNFLRAFVDYYIQQLNERSNFYGNVAIVKSIPEGSIEKFNEQDNLYTVLLRGKHNNTIIDEVTIIDSISEVVDLHEDYDAYINLSLLPTLQIIVSNTTEAGIVFNPDDSYNDNYNITYPAKLTKFLFSRFLRYGNNKDYGLYVIPCELIDNNATELKKCIDKYIDLWEMPQEFRQWNDNCNYYLNSLVDRIVTGYPKNNREEIFNSIRYIDELITVAEPYGLWVIERKGDIDRIINVDCLNKVILVNDVTDYKTRKVRLLNGAHSSFVPIAHLIGLKTVKESMANPLISSYIRKALFREIIPTLYLPNEELKEFANSVIERFENPFVEHMLLSIALNSISKWRVRVLPSMIDYYKQRGYLPKILVLSLAFLIKMYGSGQLIDGKLICKCYGIEYELSDDMYVMQVFSNLMENDREIVVNRILSNVNLWGQDLRVYEELDYNLMKILKHIDVDDINKVIKFIGEYIE